MNCSVPVRAHAPGDSCESPQSSLPCPQNSNIPVFPLPVLVGDDSTDDNDDDAGDAVSDAVDDADDGSTLCQSKTAKRHRRRRRHWNASVAAGTQQGLSESQRGRQRKRRKATASSSSTLVPPPAGQRIAPWRTPPLSVPEHDIQ